MWSLRKEDMKRLSAVEVWLWRMIKRISWMEKRTDEEVLNVVAEKRKLVDTVVRRKKNWIGHILRGDGLLRDVIEGRIEGKRPRARPRIGMSEELKEESFEKMKRREQNRDEWRCWLPRTCREAEHQ